jgi:Cu2+-exporting ATPase
MNLTGPLSIRVTAAGEDTLLSEIVRMMEAAEQGRSRHTDLARQAARIYSPLVHAVAALTFAGWLWWTGDWHQAMLATIALLIITCPCALGLAVPAVQVVASSALFSRGILVKSGTALERLAEVEQVVFDKTGTLTFGRPVLLSPPAMSFDSLAIAYGMARESSHPLSRAIGTYAKEHGIEATPVQRLREFPGEGVEAEFAGRRVRLGSRRWCGIEASESDARGSLEVCLKMEGRSATLFHFEDEVRPDAASTVAGLAGRGLSSEILSGDRAGPVANLARRLGVKSYRAEWRPQDKAANIAALADSGRKILMVGDGINDAPALAAAHVSMAPASASDIGRAAAIWCSREKNSAPSSRQWTWREWRGGSFCRTSPSPGSTTSSQSRSPFPDTQRR